MRFKLLFIAVLLLFSLPIYAAQWTATVTWPAITGSDADAAINTHCDVGVSALTKQAQSPAGSTTSSFTFTANQGDVLNCALQLERVVGGQSFFGPMGGEVATTVPFLAPGAAPTGTVTITPL